MPLVSLVSLHDATESEGPKDVIDNDQTIQSIPDWNTDLPWSCFLKLTSVL